MECIFCRIIKGELPANKVYEDEQILAFLDIAPVTRGHILVIPKVHVENLTAMTPEQVRVLFQAVHKIVQAVERALKPQGINLGMNNGKGAGQLVPHAHVHIMPRFGDDNLRLWPGRQDLYKEGEAAEIAQKIGELVK